MPGIIIAVIAWLNWEQYSAVWPHAHDFDNALLAISGVGGVLWSGAVITYSIHQDYTPRLRTAVQLIQFAFIAALIGLLASGAELRTAFYVIGCYYGVLAILSFIFRKVEPHVDAAFSAQMTAATDDAASAAVQAKVRVKDAIIKYLRRIEHGAWHFVFVAAVCLVTLVFARQDIIAWSCIAVFVISVRLVLNELFDSEEAKAQKSP
jgi:hypothetical protein